MKYRIYILFLCITTIVYGQKEPIKRISIPFESVFNLIIVPVQLNGVPLKMIFDTGSEQNLLFTQPINDSINFPNTEPIYISGLGNQEPLLATQSTNNILTCGSVSQKATIVVLTQQGINLSTRLGVEINGILSASLFKQYLIKIDYTRKKIFLYPNTSELKKSKYKSYTKLPIKVKNNRLFVTATCLNKPASLLVDTGLSDALWLFESSQFPLPLQYWEDVLGSGITGDIEGYRSQIPNIALGNINLIKPYMAYLPKEYLTHIDSLSIRNGSIGGELWSRFHVLISYTNNIIYLKKNKNFSKPFTFNRTGIEVEHSGVQWIKEEVSEVKTNDEATHQILISNTSLPYKFVLKPLYMINHIRKGSIAEIAGIRKNDILIKVNHTDAYKLTLEKINTLFSDPEAEFITLRIERENQYLDIQLPLETFIEHLTHNPQKH